MPVEPLGTLLGWESWARLVGAGPVHAVATLGAACALWSVPVATIRYVELSAKAEDLAGSALQLLPPLHIEGGVLSTAAAVPRTLRDERWVVVLDPRPTAEPTEPAAAGDRRPRYVIRDRALLVYSADRPVAQVLPWAQVNAVWPVIDLDGAAVAERLRGAVPAIVLSVTVLGTVALFGLQLLLAPLLYAFVSAATAKDRYAPSRRTRWTLSWTAMVPAAALSSPLLAARTPLPWVAGVWALVAAGTLSVAARRFRLADG